MVEADDGSTMVDGPTKLALVEVQKLVRKKNIF